MSTDHLRRRWEVFALGELADALTGHAEDRGDVALQQEAALDGRVDFVGKRHGLI